MNKRESIALHYWYERQPRNCAAIWNTRHSKHPLWLRRQFAGYVSWKYMGGPATRWQRFVTALCFYATCAIFAWHCRGKGV